MVVSFMIPTTVVEITAELLARVWQIYAWTDNFLNLPAPWSRLEWLVTLKKGVYLRSPSGPA